MKNGDFPVRYVSLPEGKLTSAGIFLADPRCLSILLPCPSTPATKTPLGEINAKLRGFTKSNTHLLYIYIL